LTGSVYIEIVAHYCLAEIGARTLVHVSSKLRQACLLVAAIGEQQESAAVGLQPTATERAQEQLEAAEAAYEQASQQRFEAAMAVAKANAAVAAAELLAEVEPHQGLEEEQRNKQE
jgi:hypothetical protein